jgi:serralysin
MELGDSSASSQDTLDDFTVGDRIHLVSVDANSLVAGDQAFSYLGAGAFGHVAGQLRFDGVSHLLQGDVDGDAVADFQVLVNGVASLSAASFVL